MQDCVAFFDIYPSMADLGQEPDCVWSTPICLPDSWYRPPPCVDFQRNPLHRPPTQMRVLGNPSTAQAITTVTYRHYGICGLFLHDGNQETEKAFYECLQGDVVCQYLPLQEEDHVDACGVIGAGNPDRLSAASIAVCITGQHRRSFVFGPYIPPAKRDSYSLVLLPVQPCHHVTSLAVNESLMEGPASDLHMALGYSINDQSRPTATWDTSALWPGHTPSERPSEDLRISPETGAAFWSTCDIRAWDTFQSCNRFLQGTKICVGLLITRDGDQRVLGQWLRST